MIPIILAASLYISIPDLDMYHEPVYVSETMSVENVERALHYNSLVRFPDWNYIAGHSGPHITDPYAPYIFKHLSRLKAGSLMRYNRKIYKVYDVKVVPPTAVSYMITPDDELRLQTCTPDGLNRIIVLAKER
jgi:LPXTG-site transpeptidase (sortase) family protein